MLSKEQKRKVAERLAWLHEDEQFKRSLAALISTDVELENLTGSDMSPNRSWTQAAVSSLVFNAIEMAMNRFEGEKVHITGRGRYAEQVDSLVKSADPFFGPYEAEVRQIGVSVFRFCHHVLTDAVGEDAAFREFAMNITRIVSPLNTVLAMVKLAAVEALAPKDTRH